MSAPDDIARRYDGEGVPPATPAPRPRDLCPSVMDAWVPTERRHFMVADHFAAMNRRQMRRDRLRDAWAIVRPALVLVAVAAGTWLLLYLVSGALGAVANPLAGSPY
jgi:hypothetical protein